MGGAVIGGAVGRVCGRGAEPDMDDTTLGRKVETELFRGTDVPMGSVNVYVVDGVVQLRGEVKRPADIKSLEARARAVPEVRGVDNLLHLPRTPSPTRIDSPAHQRMSPSSTRRPAAGTRPRTGRRRITAEPARVKDAGEPRLDELAARREGRSPAPVGSRGQSPGHGGKAPEATPPAERASGPSSARPSGDGGAGGA